MFKLWLWLKTAPYLGASPGVVNALREVYDMIVKDIKATDKKWYEKLWDWLTY